MANPDANRWPSLPYGDWAETCAALHLWTQILGKYRVAHTPWVNHAWHSTLHVTPRGMTTGAVHETGGCLTVTLDFVDHRLVVEADGGAREGFALTSMSIAEFFDRTRTAVEDAGGTFEIHGVPNEVPDALPFADDTQARPYDADAVERFHGALLRIVPVFEKFRSGFIGKVSPTHFFWGSFDLAVTRFSGRRAPLHPAGIPNLPDDVAQEAYSHEVSSAGFWPGGAGADRAMFYSYAYPAPEAFADQPVDPPEARFDSKLGEFILSYDDVAASDDPEAMLMAFLQSTYAAAANTGDWDRPALECGLGKPRVPRKMSPP
ncbi:DUF5996 family protein [Sulfitobacter sp. F26169L]|uniref:DUF5996 family protein n=1 Tax=Sulfitobacter sp. F26169L TaxID=2996015 RepID=UPI002260A7EF|nr:DUF5996 family protein [Sulfitobacter sp. F26169L]MCX7567474.1 DUF5996 family protein [Sulfitobacter sp. F26169L]